MFSRYSFALSSATFMTLALLYVMETLISMQPIVIGDKTNERTPVIFRKIRPRHLHRRLRLSRKISKEDLTESPLPPTRLTVRGEPRTNVSLSSDPNVGIAERTDDTTHRPTLMMDHW